MLLKARGIENVKGQKPCTFILQVKLKRKACSLDIMLLLWENYVNHCVGYTKKLLLLGNGKVIIIIIKIFI